MTHVTERCGTVGVDHRERNIKLLVWIIGSYSSLKQLLTYDFQPMTCVSSSGRLSPYAYSSDIGVNESLFSLLGFVGIMALDMISSSLWIDLTG